MDDPEENTFCRQPGDVQARLPELWPAFLRQMSRQGIFILGRVLCFERECTLGAELPKLPVSAGAVQDVA